MSAVTNNSPTNFVSWCQHETANLTASIAPTKLISELVRRVLIIASIIIPLVALFTYCLNKEPTAIPLDPSSVTYLSRIETFKQNLKQTCPTLQSYVRDQQIAEQQLFGADESAKILRELDLEPENLSVEKLFKRISEKVGFDKDVSLSTNPPPTRLPFAYFLKKDGHTSLAIWQEDHYMLCSEYTTCPTERASSYPINRDAMSTLFDEVIEVTTSTAIPPNQSLPLRGQLLSNQSGDLEACINLLAYLLPL